MAKMFYQLFSVFSFCLVYKVNCDIFFFFFNDTATTEIYTNLNTLSLHDALPIFLAKASLFRVPALGWLMRFSGQIPVERDATAKLGQPLQAAKFLTDRNQGVIVYPEGTLTKDSDLWPMRGKSGAVRMALEQNIPLYPAAHWGTQHWMGRYAKKIRFFPRTTIDAVVGEPFDLSEYQGKTLTRELLQEATDKLMQEIARLTGSLRGETPPAVLHDGTGAKETR